MVWSPLLLLLLFLQLLTVFEFLQHQLQLLVLLLAV